LGIPLRYVAKIGGYILKQHLTGRKRYPLVMMMEPLFRCNLACAGCGKIDYPDPLLNRRLSVDECLEAARDCGAPVVSIAGGEPLLHTEMDQVVQGLIKQRRFVYLCTNALLMEKRLDRYKPSPFFTWSVHLDGSRQEHDAAVCQTGVYDRAVAAIREAKKRGFRVNINCTLFDGADPEKVADFFSEAMAAGIDGITVSPGYAYERAPDQAHFLNRQRTKQLFRDIFRRGEGKKWQFSQSPLFLDFLAGNQSYKCSPWGNPTRNIFGWQRPCYLLGEGYAKTFAELMDETDWDKYGTGNYEKCADCMVHSGFEATAVVDAVKRPWKALAVQMRGPRTEGEMAPEIDLTNQRPADYVFSRHVEKAMAEMKHEPKRGAKHGGTAQPAAAAE
jgi:hopanoid biosynthesis associated radical SAM protein HpnH